MLVLGVLASLTASSCGQPNAIPRASGQVRIEITRFSEGLDGVDLAAVAAEERGSAFAVGSTLAATSGRRWDGTRWSDVSLPFNGFDPGLTALEVLTPANAWAVGNGNGNGDGSVDHWDGTGWQLSTPVHGPQPGGIVQLESITGVDSNDIWTVGFEQMLADPAAVIGVAARWNGNAWVTQRVPYGVTRLTASALLTPNDLWATGTNSQGDGVVVRWDGEAWSIVGTPMKALYLTGISVFSRSSAWVAGYSRGPQGNRALVGHWNGTTWSLTSPVDAPSEFRGIAGRDSKDLWAVGFVETAHLPQQTLVSHWDGTTWRVSTEADVGALNGVTEFASGNAWAVGFAAVSPPHGIILRLTAA